MNKNTGMKPEWLNAVSNAIRFFLQHISLEYDGTSRTAKVNYHGPNGWKFSVNTSFNPVVEAQDVKRIENTKDADTGNKE